MRLPAIGFVILSALGACAPSTLAISTDAPGASVFVDGSLTLPPNIGPAPYYGTVAVDVAPGESPREAVVREAVRHYVEISPPAPEWIFPFDLPVEAVHRLLSGPEVYSLHAALPPRAGIVDVVLPPRANEIGARADRMRTQR
jgi:hypothetical protein